MTIGAPGLGRELARNFYRGGYTLYTESEDSLGTIVVSLSTLFDPQGTFTRREDRGQE